MTDGPPKIPIERLIIYHSGLLPAGGLDESASLEELGENILYYFDSATTANTTVNTCCTEEAVKFLGLATALHSLPLNLSNAIRSGEGVSGSDSCGDRSNDSSIGNTLQVHLVHSTLVFIPLENKCEGCNGLVAVAQIPRAGSGGPANSENNSSGSVVTGGDPVAIRALIQRKHAGFCLLRGGTIHFRLSSFDEAKFNQQLRENDAIISGPSPRAISASNEADLERRDATRAASMAAAEAVAQSDAAWMERWRRASIGKADQLPSDDKGDSRESVHIPKRTSLTKHTGRSDAAISLLRQQSSFAPSAGIDDVSSVNNLNENKSTHSYPGMAMLYKFRKELRKSSERLTASRIDAGLYDSSLCADATKTIGNLEKKMSAAQERIDTLLAVLPLSALRNDLKAYYDNTITNAGAICALLAGQSVGRCTVDLIPSPGLSLAPRLSSLPNDPPPSTSALLNRISRVLLSWRDDNLNQSSLMHVDPVNVISESTPLLLGISAFYRGQFLHSKISSKMSKDGASCSNIDLSSDTVSIIHRHFFRGCVSEEIEQQPRESSGMPNKAGSFVQPPRILPSYDASGREILESIYIFSLGDIWLPQVTLPVCSDERKMGVVSEISARAALFKHDAYEFLVFLNGDEFISESLALSAPLTNDAKKIQVRKLQASESAITVLTSLSQQLSDVLQRIPILYADRPYEGEAGSSVIYVDRLANKVVLYNNNNADKQSSAALGGIGGTAVMSDGGEIGSDMQSYREFLIHSDDDLDCRHMLASRLPLDVVVALDEMMKEVRQSSRCHDIESNNNAVGGSRVIEMCTFLPQGWVFCRAHEHRELYGVFDPNVYITLADVQKASMRIRRELGGIML